MINFTETAILLYRQLFGTPKLAGQLADGVKTVLDGNSAVAITEACISEVAVLADDYIHHAGALAWLSEQQRVSTNFFDEKLSIQYADSARGALASVIGVTQSGHRSTVFFNAAQFSTCQDLIQQAIGRRLALVLHLDNHLSTLQGSSDGSGHDSVFQAITAGLPVLFAGNVQEAVDFTLMARYIAEMAMMPVLVVMDGAETATALQEVRLPSLALVKEFVGQVSDQINCPSVAQKQIFGDKRYRLHRWHDLDKPILQGAMLSKHTAALGHAARSVYFDADFTSLVANSFADFGVLTARHYQSVSSHQLKKADIIFIAQGACVEKLCSLADFLHFQPKSYGFKIGVIGISSLSTSFAAQLVEILSKYPCSMKKIVVLDQVNQALTENLPLMTEIRSAITAYLHTQDTTIATTSKTDILSQLVSISAGLSGDEINLADVIKLCEKIKSKQRFAGKFLGIQFNQQDSINLHPKRQSLLDNLLRHYPQINDLGIYAKQRFLPLFSSLNQKHLSQQEHLSIALSYVSSLDKKSYTTELAHYLHLLKDGFIRSSVDVCWHPWQQRQIDYISSSKVACDFSRSALVDFFIVLDADQKSLLSACERLNESGFLIFSSQSTTEISLSADVIKLVNSKKLQLYALEVANDLKSGLSISEIQWEKSLAGLTALLLQQQNIFHKTRKIISARSSLLTQLSSKKQAQLIDVFKQNLSTLSSFDLSSVISQNISEQQKYAFPKMLENMGNASTTYDSVSRFYDDACQHDSSQLLADPYLSIAAIPPLTASFNDMGQHCFSQDGFSQDGFSQDGFSQKGCGQVPQFDPHACTACGLCWENCPDSAIASVLLTPKSLIETAIKLSGTDSLRQIVSQLAARIAKDYRQQTDRSLSPSKAGELLQQSFLAVKENASFDEERLQQLSKDITKASQAIDDLPVVASENFFYAQEAKENGKGELFSLVINSSSCKSCGICVQLCQSQASNSKDSDSDLVPALTTSEAGITSESGLVTTSGDNAWDIWQATPDTASSTIERVLNEQTINAGAALMLSRYNAFALSGGDFAEPGSGEKIAMRLLLSVVEYHQQPLFVGFIRQLEQLKNDLKQEINQILSNALPTDDLNILSSQLSSLTTRQVEINELFKDYPQTIEKSGIDVKKARSHVQHILALNHLHWQLSQGENGLGRSRYSLCLCSLSISSWAGSFPYNPFYVPVHIDNSGESVQLAAGLLHGQVNDTLAAISLLRQAKADLDPRYAKATDKLKQLSWSDLTAEEKQLCPPLLLIGGDDILAGKALSQISLMLNLDYPLKVIVFSELDSGLVVDGLQDVKLQQRVDAKNNVVMMAMSQTNAYVAQTSIANSNHLQKTMEQLLSSNQAGLIRIHTPSPAHHGFATEQTINQAKLATNSRMLPLFSYDPSAAGVFGSRLNLASNLQLTDTWVLNDQQQAITPADWAITEQRFQAHFNEIDKPSLKHIVLTDWLNLTASEQSNKVPYIKNEQQQMFTVSIEMANMIFKQQQSWRTLQELAGIVTPFTAYVEKTVQQNLAAEHQAELDKLRAEYEEKISELENNYQAKTHQQIHDQLMNLAGYELN